MHIYSSFFALVVLVLASCTSPINAHSSPARPLRRLEHPSTLSVEIVPRQPVTPSLTGLNRRLPSPRSSTLRYDDSFRLILSAFDETFHLHLRPNEHIVHPAARINYYETAPDGTIVKHSKPLLRESVRAYMGEVIAEHHSTTRMREDAARVYRPSPHPAERGWARIMVHYQGDADAGISPEFEGAFSADGVIYHITTKDNYHRNRGPLDPDVSEPLFDADSNLVIWRESDVMTPEEEHVKQTGSEPTAKIPVPQSCGHDRLEYNTDSAQNPILNPVVSTTASWLSDPFGAWSNSSLARRDDAPTGNDGMGTNFIDSIGSTAGCPNEQKVVYMGVAADCTYISKYGSNDNATKQILTSWNTASALYKSSFNVSLAVSSIEMTSTTCPSVPDSSLPWNVPCSSAELDQRLSIFSQWRATKGNDGNGLWHLMSGCPTGSEVGIAWLGTLCDHDAPQSSDGSFVSGTGVSTSGRTEWQVVAHEIGHNFGAIHDCTDGCQTSDACCSLSATTCNANAQFIMSPVAQSGEKEFSQCSIGNICSLMQGGSNGKVDSSCVVSPDSTRTIISLQMCGNGIVESGEDCDPGMSSNSSCCDAATCKFRNGAVCDPDSSPCCTQQCSFAPSSQVCRPSKDTKCDAAEFCTGNSSSCPADVITSNGVSCGNDDLKCAGGQCTSIALQCQSVGGSMGLKDACPIKGDTSCLISCQSPNATNQCIQLTSLLVDGSPCGYGGSCSSGKCQSGSFLDTAKAWYTQNLQISIPVTIVAGLIVLLLLWGIFAGVRRCCGGRNVSSRNVLRNPTLQHERLTSTYGAPMSYGQPPPLRTAPPIPGSNAMYARVPPVAHDRSGSTGGEAAYNYGANNRLNWVDDSAYNGKR